MDATGLRFQPAEVGLDCLLGAARVLAPVLSATDFVLRPSRTRRVAAAARRAGHQPREVLRQIWFGRATREAFRVALQWGMSGAVSRRIIVTGNSATLSGPCVYAIYHTPWGRAMAHWLRGRSQTAVFATGRWADRAKSAHLPCDRAGLRGLLGLLKSGGCAAVTIDHFTPGVSSCDVSLMGRATRVSTGAARIARAAGVPLVLLIPRFRNGLIELDLGAPIPSSEGSPESVTSSLFAAFNGELKRDVGGWEGSYSFLEMADANR